MKKYIKPMIAFENFSLSTNIAAGCANKADSFPDFYQCGIRWLDAESGYHVLFTPSWGGCQTFPNRDDGEYNGYCYHVPTESTALFNS